MLHHFRTPSSGGYVLIGGATVRAAYAPSRIPMSINPMFYLRSVCAWRLDTLPVLCTYILEFQPSLKSSLGLASNNVLHCVQHIYHAALRAYSSESLFAAFCIRSRYLICDSPRYIRPNDETLLSPYAHDVLLDMDSIPL